MIRNCWLVLFDAKARFIDLHPPPAHPFKRRDIIGKPAWHTIAQEDRAAFKAVFAHVLRFQTGIIWDGRDVSGALWRSWLYPLQTADVAVGSIVRLWPTAVCKLTPRDRMICAGIAAGMIAKQIACGLGVKASTIGNRRSQIAHKLGIHPSALAGWCGLHAEWLG